jgi:hypothetical protein
MKHLIFAAGLLALGATAAAAQETPAAPAAESANIAVAPAKANESVTVDANRITCVMSDPATGSRLGAHRTCHTQVEWDRIRADSALLLQDMANREMNRERSIHTGN